MELLELEMIAATRNFKAGALRGVVQNENVVPEDDRVLHLLVYGKFLRALDDKKGGWGHYQPSVPTPGQLRSTRSPG